MNTIINNKDGRRSAAWTALFVLSLLAAMVLVAPTGVFAQITAQLDQEPDYALINTEHTITATVTTDGGAPYAGGFGYFTVLDPGTGNEVEPTFMTVNFDENGIAIFPYTVHTVREVTVKLTAVDTSNGDQTELGAITTNWTDKEPAPPSVEVGGKVTLNAKKKGTFRIALCSVDGLEVKDVVLDSVDLVGVKPWQSKYKDSGLCPDGKDGVKDLVFKFKNREVIEALEKSNAKELENEEDVDLTFTFKLKGETTPREGLWHATIKKEGKMHWKKSHSNSNENNGKGNGHK